MAILQRFAAGLLALAAMSGNSLPGAEVTVFPARDWEEATPESQGGNSAKLQAAIDFLRTAGGKEGVKRMAIIRNGRMIWRGAESRKPQGVWSVTKAFTSTRKGSGVYGYHWWPNGVTPEGKRRWPDAPLGAYARSGYNNNDLLVIPAWNMVTVRLGLDQQEDSITTDEYNTFLCMLGEALRDPVVDGERRVWHPLAIRFRGPSARESDTGPNPFLDYRLQVLLTGPSGRQYNVPGYFDGDGHGGAEGNVWSVRFTPDEAGEWTYRASFRRGDEVAVSLDPEAGRPVGFDRAGGSFDVAPLDTNAPGFLKWGRLEYAGGYYLKFATGPYWIRGGTDSPENFLAYTGFDRTPPSHHYADHAADWRAGDPDWGDGKGRAIIGAINYLASHGANSVYFLTSNIGGDGKDVWPWAGSPDPKGNTKNDNLHYDVGKLRQWETVFAHAQRQGVFLHFVFAEAEEPNKRELDNGELGTERKLYYRELVARFSHHLALEWNLCEEYNLGFDLGPVRIRQFAEYVQAVDPYDHPITVHSAGDPLKALRFTFGDPLFSLTSIQLGQNRIDSLTEQLRKATAEAGRPLPVSMDEFTVDKGQEHGWDPVDDAERWRVEKLWPTYLSGGNIEFILGDLLNTESFKTPERAKLWTYIRYARGLLEKLPFWEMEPADSLVTGAATIEVTQSRGRTTYPMGAQVFCKPGKVYAIYLPKAKGGARLDLIGAEGRFRQRWFNPRTGEFAGSAVELTGGSPVALGVPPAEVGADWVVVVEL